jgi:rhodanese-related sulfurtransferase
VNDNAISSPASSRGTELKRVLLEALAVTAVGAALAFAANAVSSRGLTLSRNYFPGTTNGAVSAPVSSLVQGVKQKGLQWVDAEKAVRLFRDPRFNQQMIVFIDARAEQDYRRGHIPAAFEFNPYYPEKHLADVLPACRAAEEIVVYCNGGDCEDSQFAAVTLRDAGIPNPKLWVFVGGMADWTTNRWPVETGERNSGILKKGDQ